MAAFSVRASLNSHVQTCCQLSNESPFRVGVGTRRVTFCRSTSSGTNDTEINPNVPQSPFAGGKISSKLAAKKTQQEGASPSSSVPPPPPSSVTEPTPSSVTSSPSSVTSSPIPVTSPVTSSTTETKAKATPSLAPSRKKAFAAPSVSSPFESDKRPGNIDDRILASRKSMLKALWSEKQDTTRGPAPVDIFDEPKAFKTDESRFKLIYGTNQVLVLVSFGLIACLMIFTAFVTWKLGAIHYNEL